MVATRRLALVLALLTTAGCLGAAAPTTSRPDAAASLLGADGMPLPPLALAGAGCTWGGGHSVHTFQLASIVPPPWTVADVIPDVGPQVTYSDPGEQVYGLASRAWGNWHTNFACRSWTLDGKPTTLTLGMVLTRVEAPPFDPSPVPREYVVNVVASDSDALNARLMRDGWMGMQATGSLSWDGSTFHHVLATQMHGTYESLFRTRSDGALSDTRVRLWFQKELPGGHYAPVSIDLRLSGAKPPAHDVADPDGWFSHTNTQDHVVVAGEPTGAASVIAGLVVSGFDASFAWGPAPGVELTAAYDHL